MPLHPAPVRMPLQPPRRYADYLYGAVHASSKQLMYRQPWIAQEGGAGPQGQSPDPASVRTNGKSGGQGRKGAGKAKKQKQKTLGAAGSGATAAQGPGDQPQQQHPTRQQHNETLVIQASSSV